MKTIKSISLENTTDGHSKEYRLSLEDQESGVFEVIALWGKIGSSLTRTVKFSGDQDKADKQFAKIVSGQLAKGYVQVGAKNDGQTAATTGSTTGKVRDVIARVQPMLCGALPDLAALEPYLLNDHYVLEEKFNGTRKEITRVGSKTSGSKLFITNKQGQPTAKGMLPATQSEFIKLDFDYTVDTEDEPVGGGCVLLDIITLRGKPLDRLSRAERRPLLEAFYSEGNFDPKIVRLSGEVVGQKAKRAFLKRIKDEGGEGVIVKDNRSLYLGGDAGRAVMFKFKFQATASFIVSAVGLGGKRNIGVALLDGLRRVDCGKCAIPVNANFEEIKAGDIVECRFLYAEPGSHKLNQPFYLGKRTDVAPSECQIVQLKYKQQSVSDDD